MTYGERASTSLSNAGVIQTFGVNDLAIVDILARTIGDTTIEYETLDIPIRRASSVIARDRKVLAATLSPAGWRRLTKSCE